MDLPHEPVMLTATDVRLFARAHKLAVQAIVADVETDGVRVRLPGDPRTWYDTRPMLDPREAAPEVVDMAREALAYGLETGILAWHADQKHLVCVMQRGQ